MEYKRYKTEFVEVNPRSYCYIFGHDKKPKLNSMTIFYMQIGYYTQSINLKHCFFLYLRNCGEKRNYFK